MTRRPTARFAGALAAAALVLGTAACSEDPNSVAAQAKAGDQKGYVSGTGAVETIPQDKRAEPVGLKGDLVGGGTWDSASARGEDVVVVNVWGSWCAPCVAEAPDLQKVWAGLQSEDEPVQFMGIDFREGPASGAAFAKRAGITYPSLSDKPGLLILALQGKAPTVPTTLVLDTDGRIAARVNGPVDATTLRGLVDDVLAES
ncbi:TlpA family protein disulfide reductase [Oryzobacter telluris]|uniref:TlpA family protein disulfide reductase n=1 Tax=Oryzobacter telluris TaxID=3149179 RepID=UPI00370DAD59